MSDTLKNRTVTWAHTKKILGQKRIVTKTVTRKLHVQCASRRNFGKYKQTLSYKSENCFKPVKAFELNSVSS